MSSHLSTATAATDTFAQCEIGRGLVAVGRLLIQTPQDDAGLQAALADVERLRIDLMAVAEHIRNVAEGRQR